MNLGSRKFHIYCCLPFHLLLLAILAVGAHFWGGSPVFAPRGLASDAARAAGSQSVENKLESESATLDSDNDDATAVLARKRLKFEPIEAPYRFERTGRLVVEPVRPGEDAFARAPRGLKRGGEASGLTRTGPTR